MASLTGQSIASSYKDLLQVSNSNSGVDATLRPIEDGEGTASALNVSSGAVATFSSKPYLQYSTADETNYEVLAIDKVDEGNGRIRVFKSGTGTNRGFEIQTGGSASLTITSNQNVGIGTSSPSEALTVSGNIDLKNSSGFAKIDNSGTLSMTDDATVTISSSRNGSALILVYEVGSGIGALFFTNFGLAVTKLAGTSLTANSDSDSNLCCFNSGHTITVKNRLGGTKSIVITVLGGNVY